ncbi:hypothetical protein [uncultured Bacteroides sp.]|uniref:hypothetical protein n=1 Tax=uncultured Bacteroides sp. TaxID=162156 RepID=UPI002601166C|nr:hypothetical protein [uncultured Bacteroides sp.]
MKVNRIVLIFIILLSVSCRTREDMSAYFDEGRIEDNAYISDSAGWKMTIPEGWELTQKINEEDVNEAQEYFDTKLSMPFISSLVSLKKETLNTFRSCIYHNVKGNIEELKEFMASSMESISSVRSPVEIISISPIEKEFIDNIEFQTYSYQLYLPYPTNKKIYGISYMSLIGNKYIEVSMNYTNSKNKKEIIDAWRNSVFDKSKWEKGKHEQAQQQE